MRKTVIGPDVGSDLELFEGVEGVDGLPHAEAVAVDVPGYRRLYVSGTGPLEDGEVVAPGDPAGQLEHILETISEILALVDGEMADVVRMRLVTEPLDEDEYLDVCRVRERYLAPGHEPASTMVESADVGVEGMRLEVDVDAVIPDDGWTVETADR